MLDVDPWNRGLNFQREGRDGQACSAPRRGAVSAGARAADDFLGAVPVGDRDVVPLALAGVDLPRPGDFLLRVFLHLHPLRDPAGGAGIAKMTVNIRSGSPAPRR